MSDLQRLHAASDRYDLLLAPWYAVPADDNKNARLIVSLIVLDALEGLGMSYPKPTAARKRELVAARNTLSKKHT